MTPDSIGRYKTVSELGRGGMATVYYAHDPNFDRAVAIKVLPREFLHDPEFRERFEREARTVAALEHSAIVPVYDYGEQDEQLYLVMRYMPGGSLEDRIRQGPIPLDEAASIVERLGRALDEAHQRGIVHRDLKPANILFDQYDDPHLSDFGIAKLVEAGGSLTGTGIIGTPAYMSPEQARGDKDLDGRSDIYALGVILFEMLTGKTPYESDTPMGLAVKHILEPIPDILTFAPQLPEQSDLVIKRALAKNRENRYLLATDLGEALMMVAQDQPLSEDYLPVSDSAHQEDNATQPYPPESARQALTEAAVSLNVGTARRGPKEKKSSSQTQEKPDNVPRSRRKRGRGLLGCLVAIGIVMAVLVGTFLAITLAFSEFIAALPLPPEILAFLDFESVELSGKEISRQISQDVATYDELDIRLQIAHATTTITAQEEGAAKVSGSYLVDSAFDPLDITLDPRDTRAILTIEQPAQAAAIGETSGELDLQLPTGIPLDLTISNGLGSFGNTTLDLTDLNIRSLTVEGGSGRLHIILPQESEMSIDVSGGAGDITIEAPDQPHNLTIKWIELVGGVGSISLEIPDGSSYQVDLTIGLGSAAIKIPDNLGARVETEGEAIVVNKRFVETEDNVWQTDDYRDAVFNVLIKTDGAGSIRIED